MRRGRFILALWLTVATGLCSCGSHRSVVKQKTAVEAVSNTLRKDTMSAIGKVKEVEQAEVVETIEEITTVYDATQPVDSATGRPPVVSETRRTIRRESSKRRAEEKAAVRMQSGREEQQERAVAKTTGEEEKQRQEATTLWQVGGTVWAFVVLGIVGLAGWLFYKRRKR